MEHGEAFQWTAMLLGGGGLLAVVTVILTFLAGLRKGKQENTDYVDKRMQGQMDREKSGYEAELIRRDQEIQRREAAHKADLDRKDEENRVIRDRLCEEQAETRVARTELRKQRQLNAELQETLLAKDLHILRLQEAVKPNEKKNE